MKLATWNVNSLNVRLPHVTEWLRDHPVDVLCLQETKVTNDKFPLASLETSGYGAVFSGQKTYNGVAILARTGLALEDVVVNIPGFEDDQQRVLSATIGDVRIVCVYVPNGQSLDSEKYQYKLRWLTALTNWLTDEVHRYPSLAVLGDYNIAPEDRDVHDPLDWGGQVLVSEPERAAFRKLTSLGLHDAFRLFAQEPKLYSWWDYRMLAFRRNRGLRIDHILLSDALARQCTNCNIDKDARRKEQPSDHAPVIASLAIVR